MSVQWIIAIGTAILAIVALFQDFIRSWLATPSLEISTGSCSPFCKKLLFKSQDDPNKQADGYALRIRVKNVSPFLRLKSRAESVEVFALKLSKRQTDNSFQPISEFEPMNLIWSHSFVDLTDISPEMERYCFIGRMLKPADRQSFPEFDDEKCVADKTCLRIDVALSRNTKDHIIQPGTYQLECLIGSSNTKAFKKTFEIFISGNWSDDEQEMYRENLTIKEVS